MLETVRMPCTYKAVFYIREWYTEKTTASRETPRPEAKAQSPGRGLSLLTLRPEQEQNKHTPRRHWSLCWPPTGNGPRGGARQQEPPQTSKFTPPKKN